MALIKNLSINLLNIKKVYNLNPIKSTNLVKQFNQFYSTTQIKEDIEIDEFLNDKEYLHLKSEFIKSTPYDQKVLVVQPFIKRQENASTPDLMLDETSTLAESIPNWKVVYKMKKGLNSLNRFNVFRPKQLESIFEEINQNKVNNVVIGLDWLSGAYQMKIEKELGVDVYDRYSMILRIFHLRSTTKESKIQTQLAEIPYIRSRLNLFSRNPDHHQAHLAQTIGTGGKDYYNRRKFLLDKREKALRKELAKLENARALINPARRANKVPVVGIVGYTNSGKTSLIKHFSKNQSIKPMDKLFATLDLSRFMIKLNNNQDVYLLDTIGFISNIPKNLLDAFNSTLKEITDCDLIIHIYDANHPDLDNQIQTVYQTLFDQIKITDKLKETMIEIGNKIDLISEDKFKQFTEKNPAHLFISVTEKINLPILADRMQETLEKNLDLIHRKFKVMTGSDAYQFLITNSVVKQQEVDEANPNYCKIDCSISKKHYYHLMDMLKTNE